MLMRKSILAFCSWLLVLTAVNAAAEASALSISRDSTDTSAVVLSGNIDTGEKWLWIHVTKDGDAEFNEENFVPLDKREVFKVLYLRRGPGIYRVVVSEGKSDNQYEGGYYEVNSFTINNTDSIDRGALLPTPLVQSDDPNIATMAVIITLGIDDPLLKSKAIHDWVALHVAYDVDAYYSGQIRNYSAKETFLTGKAVCNGYARLNAALHRAVGIPAMLVIGHAGGGGIESTQLHEWNTVLINGQWIIEDATWDSGYVTPSTKSFTWHLSQRYFNPAADVFARDHQPGTIVLGE